MKPPERNKIISIKWIDSVETEGWVSISTSLAQQALEIHTIGYLLSSPSEYEPYWIVCRDWSEDTDTVCGVMKIPQVAVTEHVVLEVSSVFKD